jgi:hypothetical protein
VNELTFPAAEIAIRMADAVLALGDGPKTYENIKPSTSEGVTGCTFEKSRVGTFEVSKSSSVEHTVN